MTIKVGHNGSNRRTQSTMASKNTSTRGTGKGQKPSVRHSRPANQRPSARSQSVSPRRNRTETFTGRTVSTPTLHGKSTFRASRISSRRRDPHSHHLQQRVGILNKGLSCLSNMGKTSVSKKFGNLTPSSARCGG